MKSVAVVATVAAIGGLGYLAYRRYKAELLKNSQVIAGLAASAKEASDRVKHITRNKAE
jgi:uncharacterized membrane protein YebE (DUF533 family)